MNTHKKNDDFTFSDIQNFLKKNINEDVFQYIRVVYNRKYKILELNTLKAEICYCIMMGFYSAAMTLTNHTLEKFLKSALISNEALKKAHDKKSTEDPFELTDEIEKGNSKYDGKVLNANIDFAFKENLITKEEKEKLYEFKNKFRDPYSHSQKSKTYRGAEVKLTGMIGDSALKFIDDLFVKGKSFDEAEKELPKRQVKMENASFADFLFGKHFAAKDCIPYLIELDKIIKNVESKIFRENKNKYYGF